MKDDAQATTSVWMATANTPSQSRLKANIRTDVCIIGPGIAGMTTAYLLAKEGRSVVVIDDGAARRVRLLTNLPGARSSQ